MILDEEFRMPYASKKMSIFTHVSFGFLNWNFSASFTNKNVAVGAINQSSLMTISVFVEENNLEDQFLLLFSIQTVNNISTCKWLGAGNLSEIFIRRVVGP